MRKTIDEIKIELSEKPTTTSFRVLSQEEQGLFMGKRNQFFRKVIDIFLPKRFFTVSK